MFGSVRSGWRRLLQLGRLDPDAVWLRRLHGVIHVGANTGQERALYHQYRLPVVWIEPIPEVFARLQANIAGLPAQRAVQALVADEEGRSVAFHVASNDGLSSSMLDLAGHRELWPQVGYRRTLELRTTTLDALVRDGAIAPADGFDALVMDTQGSELQVLRGATALLAHIDYLQTEAADFEAYAGGCRLAELDEFLRARGFEELRRTRFAARAGLGAYYDVVYRRRGAA